MAVVNLTAADFEESTKNGVALIDFWAPWCGPCRAIGPVLEELEGELGEQATFAKINCDEEAALAQKFGVGSIPAVFILKDGETVEQMIGVRSKDEYESAVNKALGN